MKTLVLIRHAKSSWDSPGLTDHDRPLNDRGLRDAPAMGRRLAERGLAPDMIVSSTAVRALATAELIATELGVDPQRIVADERLYAASPDEVIDVIRALDDAAAVVVSVGHNPETSALAARFSDEIGDLPTCAVVEFGFDVDTWSEVGDRPPVSVWFSAPRS